MKYVLIVEKEDTCYQCPLCEVEFGWHGDVHKGVCRRTYDDVTVYLDGVSGRPKWCPLKPMPDIKTEEAIKLANMINPKATFQEFADGWNACLKELEK